MRTGEDVEDSETFVAFIPGGGWMIERKNEDGTVFIEPVVGWGMTTDGAVYAVDTDGLGQTERLDQYGDSPRVFHPEIALLSAEKAKQTCCSCRRYVPHGAPNCVCGQEVETE